ncbi:MFS transporter [Paraburkholderia sp. BCC1885]|uniref:MFS transporter n=1 Tax=Paraburkholderia sp. BCC1885 TaxID=2562669 RepID=UPI001182C8A2|nr:MFS transporter [Paraburkholderia sp. BCC1885]
MKRIRLKPTTLVLLMLCLMYMITYVDRVNISTAAGQFKFELGLTNAQLGLVFSAYAYPYVVFQFIGGWVSDRFGAKRTLICCSLIWALATALTGLAGGFATLVAARLLLGLGEGATFPAATTAMATWFAKDKRGMAQGITHSSARLGNAIAPILVYALIKAFNWRFSFYVLGLLSLGWVLMWSVKYRDVPAHHPNITPEELESIPAPRARVADPKGTTARLFWRMLPVCIVYFSYCWILWLMLDWMPLYFMHSFHLDIKKAVIFTTAVFVAGVVGDLAGGLLTDHLLRRTNNPVLARSCLVAVCMSLTALSVVPVLFVHDPMISLIFLAAAMFFNEMSVGPMWAVPMDIASSERSGAASGIMASFGNTSAIICPIVAGFLADRPGGWNLTFMLSIGVMVGGVLLVFAMRPNKAFVVSPPSSRGDAVGEGEGRVA